MEEPSMSKQASPDIDRRKVLLVGGVFSAAIGLILILCELGYLLLTFSCIIEGESYPIAWQFLCCFLGWPLLFAGTILLHCGLVSERNTKHEKPSA